MAVPNAFPALVVSKSEIDSAENNSVANCEVKQIGFDDLDQGDTVVEIAYSAINYKDGLASIGDPGVARKLPLIPGIDAVGKIVASAHEAFNVGDQVFIASAKFGTAHHGGFAIYARVPADWVFKLPTGMTALDAVTWGTAGFTAAQSVEQLIKHDIATDAGDVLVTGATGGVGVFAVKLLSRLGFRVVASTGKTEKQDWLKELGAAEIITRQDAVDESKTPLLKSRWAAVVDTVGGATLSTAIRSTQPSGVVTACGLVAGNELDLTVFPFILRGVTLCGIDSANISRATRINLWDRISRDWQFELLNLQNEINLERLPGELPNILAGKSFGRTIVKMT